MKIEKFSIKTCCGKNAIIFKINKPLTKEFLASLISVGFKETEHFTKAGILYADNSDFIITGPFGSNRLQVKCKKSECSEKINDFEALLLQLG